MFSLRAAAPLRPQARMIGAGLTPSLLLMPLVTAGWVDALRPYSELTGKGVTAAVKNLVNTRALTLLKVLN